ncbi:MAG TPA: ROK family protein [Solirubrobacterales bacterium]|nr:ROK family protein [Solirubrobacterales bacterium]
MVADTLGIDLGGSLIKAVVCSAEGDIRERVVEPSLVEQGPAPTFDRVADLIERLRASHGIQSIGLGICGPVDHAAGAVRRSPILPGWNDVLVIEALAERVGAVVQLENDAACAILGEWWQGAGTGLPIVAGVTLGTGIGGGLIVDGSVYRGHGSWGAEFGHVAVADGPACPCGGSGCVNQLASVTATLDRYRQLAGADVSDVDELLRKSEEGDDAARQALATSAHYLSKAVRTLLNVLNPSVFVLAGGMAQMGQSLGRTVEEQIAGSTFEGLDSTPVRVAQLGLFSGAVGAARLATS